MLDLSDLGLAPVESAATGDKTQVAANHAPTPAGLVPGSMMARVLYATFARQPVTIVDSPPGAGKSTLIVDVLVQLLRRSEFQVVVATPTRNGAVDLTKRLVAALGTGEKDPMVVFGVSALVPPEGAHRTVPQERRDGRWVTVRTVASCVSRAPECDLMVFDEAYQTTFADAMGAADCADQVMMVGDPGQIGPVVTQNTSAWDRMRSAPHRRAPEVFAQRDDALIFQMDATYRLGADTVAAIAPLYGFGFDSKRPDRHLVDVIENARLPELASARVAPSDHTGDVDTLKAVARRAMDLVGAKLVATDADGTETTERLAQADVAVVVSHNDQATGIEAMLRAAHYDGIAVGTADRLQGGQWHAVVALDPLVGHGSISPHQLNPGRLCVMASRHLTHLTWIGDGQEVAKLTAAVEEAPEAKVGIAVRRHLTAT